MFDVLGLLESMIFTVGLYLRTCYGAVSVRLSISRRYCIEMLQWIEPVFCNITGINYEDTILSCATCNFVPNSVLSRFFSFCCHDTSIVVFSRACARGV